MAAGRRGAVGRRGGRGLRVAASLLIGSLGIWGCAAMSPGVEPRAPSEAVARRIGSINGRSEVGLASWYGGFHQGRVTAAGEIFDMTQLTAAHPALPLGTSVRVTNLKNGRIVRVRVNDRGPYVPGRIVDLSREAARVLDMVERGVGLVRLDVETTGAASVPTRATPERTGRTAAGGWT